MRKLSLSLALICAMSFAQAQTTVYADYVNSQDGFTQYVVPDYGQLQSFSETLDGLGNKVLTFTLKGSIPVMNNDRITVEAYYDTPNTGLFDTAVVGVKGNYVYRSSTPLSSGQAGSIDIPAYTLAQSATMSVSGNTIQVVIPASAVGGPASAAKVAIVRYLPANADAVAGMNDASIDSAVMDSSLAMRRLAYPAHPSGLGPTGRPAPATSGKAQLPLRFNDQIPIRGPSDTCPPTGSPPKPGDINGDGRNDWDYPDDQPLGNNGKLIDIWGIDLGPPGGVPDDNGTPGNPNDDYYPDCFIIVVGHDDNGNGRLDAGEIDAAIGACTFIGGLNHGWIDRATNVVHWVNERYVDSNGNGRRDPGERIDRKRHYIYNPNTGKLKVYYDPDGDGPQPPILEWPAGNPSGGDPNDYPGWPGGFPA